MASVSTGVGLISGLNYQDIVNKLIAVEHAPIDRMTEQEKSLQARQAAIQTLSANLLTLSTSAGQLALARTFDTLKAVNSDTSQLSVTVSDGAQAGNYQFQTVRLASAQQLVSRGFVNADQQTIGTGSITISTGGRVATDTSLSALNGGAGVRRGVIRVTDLSGATAQVDLTGAVTVTDVLDAINSSGLSVVARAQGDHLVVEDTTGLTSGSLAVADVAGGHAADDLGIAQSLGGATLTGASIYQATGAFTLAHLNNGNELHLAANQPDLRITLTDAAATTIDVDLDGAYTVQDVLNRINGAAGNAGKLTASLSAGHLVLTDNTGGGGAQPLSVADINGASVTGALGLGGQASGNTLTGGSLVAGINSVLLRNLRGGQGIDQLGQISLTDRAGRTAVVDLSGAQSLDEVLASINDARDTGNVKLQLTAILNGAGNRIQIHDTSGGTGNLLIADVGTGTLAAQLRIAVDVATNSVNSGALHLQFVTAATSLSNYAPGGGSVRRGGFSVTDSAGQQFFVNISDNVKTLGDVFQAIQSATGGRVTARLNDTGDGFALIDQAGGSGQLQVLEIGSGKTAADLRLTGPATTTSDGKSQIVSRQATIVDIVAGDTLNSIRDKLNAAGAGLGAFVVDDGTTFTPKRLVLTSSKTGESGRLVVDDEGLGLGLNQQARGDDALLRVGGGATGGFVLSSATNHFASVVPGVDVDVLAPSDQPAQVNLVRDTSKVTDLVKQFVDGYNALVDKLKELTKFDTDTNTGGALQGTGIALRLSSSLSELITGDRYGANGGLYRSLGDLGISLGQNGKLTLDSSALQQKIEQSPDDAHQFFLDATGGFAGKLKKTIESFTDPLTGRFTEETNSLQASVDNLEKRIDTLNSILEVHRERLLTEFINLESVLSTLQSQQSALSRIQNLYASAASGSSS